MATSPPQPPPSPIVVLSTTEPYEEIDGLFTFTGTIIIYETPAGALHHAFSPARHPTPSAIQLHHLTNITPIPVSAYNPPFPPSGLMRAPEPLPPNSHVKKPCLTSYDRIRKRPHPNAIADALLQEAKVCERVKRHPHPNIAVYLGCQVSSDGRLTGLCFARYPTTLMQEVNPGSLGKRHLRSVRPRGKDYSGVLAGVERGVRHLHGLGWAHNDINPSNIMLDGDEGVVIDLGSCTRVGESLRGVGRTYEWYDEKVEVAVPQNDIDALDEIRTWLGEGAKPFRFAE